MNTEAILAVADALEHNTVDNDFTFKMHVVLALDKDHGKSCGCFIGATILTLIPHRAKHVALYGNGRRYAMSVLGLDAETSLALFYPVSGQDFYNDTPEGGSRILRHLVATGEVDHNVGRGGINQ